MPSCKTCGNHIPNRVKIDGVVRFLSHRSHCLDCSPYKRERKAKKEFQLHTCTICNNIYKYRPGHGVGTKKCYSCAAYLRRARLKARMVEYKGGKCEVCGYNKCMKALQFHHIDRAEKEINLSASLAANHKWEKVQQELDKCQLLCANCHHEIEAEIFRSISPRPELTSREPAKI
jgi:hypothetical protein